MDDESQKTLALVAVWIASVGGCYLLGRYNRQPVMSLVVGVLLGPIGFIIAAASAAKCPYCASPLPFGAKVCPHCTRDLPPV